MVFGGISYDVKTPLILCENKIDHKKYLKILKKAEILKLMHTTYGRFNWIFMQDGAPAHRAKETINKLTKMKIRRAKKQDIKQIAELFRIEQIKSPYKRKSTKNISIKKGETIHTENSHKFTDENIKNLASGASLEIQNIFTDRNKWFSLVQLIKN